MKDNFVEWKDECKIIIRHNKSSVGKRSDSKNNNINNKHSANIPFRTSLESDFINLFAV
jgi:hypothetical protein